MSDAAAGRFPFLLRSVLPSDEPAILELLRLTLGEKTTTRKTGEYWRWKHVLNPFGASYSVCAEEPVSHDLAGLRILMPWRFLDDDGTAYRAARPVDTATHPSYQRRGIFSALTRYTIRELKHEGVAFFFNTPNANSLPGNLKMGWRVVARWPVHARPVNPLRTAWKALSGKGRQAGVPDLAACGLTEWGRFRGEHSAALEDLVGANERKRIRTGYRTRRDLAYLDWRYGAHPDIRYGVHATFDRSGRLDGVLVVRPTRGARGLAAMVVTELFSTSPAADGYRRLMGSALRRVPCDYWTAHFSEGTEEHRALRRLGFFRAPGRGYTWVALPLNEVRRDPAEPGSWDLTLGELEIF
jgi:GNAT superfamily N-acetyltransferase